MKNCKNCGVMIDDNQTICQSCGTEAELLNDHNLMNIYRKRLMDYMHNEFTVLFYGILFVAIGIVGLFLSNWIFKGILDGYRGRMNLIVFFLPVIMGGLILFGCIAILNFPFGMVKKLKHAKFLKTEEGEKVIADFLDSTCYFKDEIRIGKIYFYKSNSDFYSFNKIELFKLTKQEKKISLLYKNKNEREQSLINFDKDSWQKNKDEVINFFKKIQLEHPEISLEVL